MVNYIDKIAKIDKKERFEAIIKVLGDNNVPYAIQKLPYGDALGNIIVRFNSQSENKTVISAHYDNVKGTPGANDNATACSILLNLINDFKETNEPFEFVFFDLEEKGFLGSKYYMDNNYNNIRFAINMDMCGLGENILVSENLASFKLNELLYKHQCKTLKMLPPGDAYTFLYNGVKTLYIVNSSNHDLKWFEDYSKRIYPSYQPDFLKTMHQPSDTADTLNYDTIEKIYLFAKEVLENNKYL